MTRTARFVLFAMLALLALPACQWTRLKLGLGYDVDVAAPGTPEAVLQSVLKAGLEPDAEKGWLAFLKLLHTNQKDKGSLESWKGMKFRELRKKASNYVSNVSTTGFTVKRIREEDDGNISYFLHSPKTDMPTPCTVKPDPEQSNEWRVTRCSL
jgi:hypothetical protein